MRLVSFIDQHSAMCVGAIAGERVIDLTQTIAALALPASSPRAIS